jgi:hypothetical protein
MYIIVNIISTFLIAYAAFDDDNLFVYPGLIERLREDLNIPGTIIITALFSIFFAPALVGYFVLTGLLMGLILLCELFKYLFRRRD